MEAQEILSHYTNPPRRRNLASEQVKLALLAATSGPLLKLGILAEKNLPKRAQGRELAKYGALVNELLGCSLFSFDDQFLNDFTQEVKDQFLLEVSKNREITPLQLASYYEHLIDAALQFKRGVVYTPLQVARLMVQGAFHSLLGPSMIRRASELPKIADPACGSGVFLVQAFHELTERCSFPDALPAILHHSLYGVDIDPIAVEMTRICLSLSFLTKAAKFSKEETAILQQRIITGNSLLQPSHVAPQPSLFPELTKDPHSFSAFSWEEQFPEVYKQSAGFSLIIGNPPYGLKRGERLSPEENSLLKQVYESFREGKIDKYLLFIARGLQLVQEGGILSFVVPNSWLGVRAGRKLRRELLRHHTIEELYTFGFPLFPRQNIETVIFRVRKGKPHDSILLTHFDAPEDGRGKNVSKSFQVQLSVRDCLLNQDATIPTKVVPGLPQLSHYLDETCIPLHSHQSPFRSLISLQAYSVGRGTPPQTAEEVADHVYHYDHKYDESTYKYLEGSDIQRYSLGWSGRWLRHGPWLAEPHDLEYFIGPRLLIREITGKFPHLVHGTYTEEPALYNKSVLHILPRLPYLENDHHRAKQLLHALLVILNSTFGGVLLYYRGRKSQRTLFPKFVNDDLRTFPIPADLERFSKSLAKLGKGLLEAHAEQDEKRIRKLEKDAELEVCLAYGLTPEMRAVIEKAVEEFKD